MKFLGSLLIAFVLGIFLGVWIDSNSTDKEYTSIENYGYSVIVAIAIDLLIWILIIGARLIHG